MVRPWHGREMRKGRPEKKSEKEDDEGSLAKGELERGQLRGGYSIIDNMSPRMGCPGEKESGKYLPGINKQQSRCHATGRRLSSVWGFRSDCISPPALRRPRP